jgi:putative tricarboxylic transport membrane protein
LLTKSVVRLGKSLPFVVTFIAGVYLWQLADRFDFIVRSDRAGPDLWPKIVLGLMLLAALWGTLEALLMSGTDELSPLVRAALRAVNKEEEGRQEIEAEAGEGDRRYPARAMMGLLILFGFVACIGVIGFTLAVFLLMFSVMLLAGYRRPIIAASVAIVGTLCFFFVFQRIAYLSLPLGVGPFRELSTFLMTLMGVR